MLFMFDNFCVPSTQVRVRGKLKRARAAPEEPAAPDEPRPASVPGFKKVNLH